METNTEYIKTTPTFASRFHFFHHLRNVAAYVYAKNVHKSLHSILPLSQSSINSPPLPTSSTQQPSTSLPSVNPSSINSTMAAASGSTNPLQTTNERLNCPGCNEPVGDQPVIFAAGRLWHREHFRCSEPKCKRQLDNNYHLMEKKPFCIDCHTTKQAPRCANESCSRPLKGETYLALERYWHPECFRCEGCGQQLIGGQHYVVDDRQYDLGCHWNRRLEMQNRRERI